MGTKLGTTKDEVLGGKAKGLLKVSESLGKGIDAKFLSINMMIDSRQFSVDVSSLLKLNRDDFGNFSDEELDLCLELCSYFRFTFYSAYCELLTEREKVERQFKVWLAERRSEVFGERVSKRLEMVKLGCKPGWLGQITVQEIEDAIMLANKDIFEEYSVKIQALKKDEKLLLDIHDNLTQRGFHLMNIANRRMSSKNRPDYAV